MKRLHAKLNPPKSAIAFSVAVFLACAFGFLLPARAEDSLVHKPAPPFVRESLSHKKIDLAAYRGHVVLLSFWATWCAPCQIEIPRFTAWQKQYAPQGFQVLAVSMDDDEAPVLALMRKKNVNYPVVMGDERLGKQYGGILGLPVNFLIDRDGRIAAQFKGETDLNTMERQLQGLLNRR